MGKLTKNQKAVIAKYDAAKEYKLAEACELVKEITYTKFDASVELHVNLGVDPRKANQMVRGVVTLPHGTGKVTRVLVLCTPDKENEAREAGADYVGLDEYIEKIKGGWTDVDVIICTPSVMAKVGVIGRILGPRGQETAYIGDDQEAVYYPARSAKAKNVLPEDRVELPDKSIADAWGKKAK